MSTKLVYILEQECECAIIRAVELLAMDMLGPRNECVSAETGTVRVILGIRQI